MHAEEVALADRASAFGIIMASFSMGILIGPALGAVLNPLVAASVAAGTGAVCILFIMLLLPESLSQEAATAVRAWEYPYQIVFQLYACWAGYGQERMMPWVLLRHATADSSCSLPL